MVPGIIPKRDLGIPICRGNVLGTSLHDALHVIRPGLGVYNPMRCLKGSLVGIVQLLQVLLDARIDICPTLGLHMRCQVKLGGGGLGCARVLVYGFGTFFIPDDNLGRHVARDR
ncbi:hypothetical protein Tco_0117488 [Tanacetum coccineum]